MMKTLELCHFPLDSLSLIEASAGTGKTYAVANLYLRYLLERKLSVEEILVVTFTEAATQELRDRIRARIQELISVFNGIESNDEVLNYLFQNSEDTQADSLRLRIAERQIDQAEIHTIHGFCQQLLLRYALDLNVSFNQTLVEDAKPILLKVCEDFWRSRVLKLQPDLMLEVYRHWATPKELMSELEPMINRRPERFNPEGREGGLEAWEKHFRSVSAWFLELRENTIGCIDEVRDIVSTSGLKAVKKKLEWLDTIRSWCQSDVLSFDFPKNSTRKNLFQVFVPDSLLAETKKNARPPEHPYFTFLEAHLEQIPLPSREVFLVQCYQEISAQLRAEKEAQNVVGFDDLILSVSDALSHTKTRDLLINTLRERFSVALIDEFQDTDREQYHIFSSIFASSLDQKEDAAMVLIGDPKQAIYAFRGGDIATYLRAKHDISKHQRGQLFTMDTNWRSSPSMVTAVNQVFLKQENAFIADSIPFFPVKAAKETPVDLKRVPALDINLLRSEGRNKEDLESILANYAAQQILSLLEERAVVSSDIAILVRSSREAELMKIQLLSYGLGASYEGKSNIYESEEALAIYGLLAAMAEPTNEYLVKHCLSDLFFCVDDQLLLEMKHDDEVLETYLNIFKALHICWLRYGVLAAIRKAMNDLGLFDVWRENPESEGVDFVRAQDWERRLTNVNQLAELLQRQSEQTRGHFALLRWLRQNISASAQASDESRLRLESDEQLIRIVTIHKSKGLEYPYVFLPFINSARGADFSWFYDESGRLNLDLMNLESNASLVERERLAEDIRLLYVALTRAKYQCFLNTFYYKGRGVSLGLPKTAWAYLISSESALSRMDEESYVEALRVLAQESEGMIGFSIIDETTIEFGMNKFVNRLPDSLRSPSLVNKSETFSNSLLERSLADSWRVQSFTGLMQETNANAHSSAIKRFDRLGGAQENTGLSIMDFPKGSKAGTFLHTLFENIDFESASPLKKVNAQGQPICLQKMVSEKLELSQLVAEEQVESWADYLSKWLIDILKTPLAKGLSLSSLAFSDYQAEMEFIFKVEQCNLTQFNQLINEYNDMPPLDFRSFEGHLKGAIDLVFVREGKYYLLDYKSNYLGEDPSDYSQEKLHEAMLDHRYDLQYLIYSLALHRYLRNRLGQRYSYEQNFGGVYYLYLRGMTSSNEVSDAGEQHPGIYYVKPKADLILALDRHMGSIE